MKNWGHIIKDGKSDIASKLVLVAFIFFVALAVISIIGFLLMAFHQ